MSCSSNILCAKILRLEMSQSFIFTLCPYKLFQKKDKGWDLNYADTIISILYEVHSLHISVNHSIYICTVSSKCLLPALSNWLKPVYGLLWAESNRCLLRFQFCIAHQILCTTLATDQKEIWMTKYHFWRGPKLLIWFDVQPDTTKCQLI